MAHTSARIVTTSDVLGGDPRISGRRVGVLDIYEQVEWRGADPKAVADRYDLEVADVYHALAYDHDNAEEMNDVRRRRERTIERYRNDALTPDTDRD